MFVRMSHGVGMQRRRRGLRTRQKAGPNLHSRGTESECSGDSESIGDPAGSDHLDADGIGGLRNQRRCFDLQSDRAIAAAIEENAPMSTRFIALSNHGIDTMLFQPARSATSALHKEWRISGVPPGQRGADRRSVLMSEQLMLPSGLYVEKSTE